MEIVIYLLGILSGLLIALFIKHISKEKPVGTIRIDRSDPNDTPYMFLELNVSLRELATQKEAWLKISTENYISR